MMGRELPLRAERFLHAVARELQSLSSTDRDAVLLELRSHLVDQAAAGGSSLDDALRALGSPVDLAAGFEEGHGAGLVQVPQAFAVPWRPMRVREVLLEVRATLLASRDGLMMVGVILSMVSAASFLAWTHVYLGGFTVGAGATMVVAMAATMLGYCAGYRIILSDMRRPWRLTPSTFRFIAAMLAVDLGNFGMMVAGGLGATSLLSAAGASPASVKIFGHIWGIAASAFLFCIELRIQPWLVAQAVGRHDVTFGASWRGTSGRVLNILRGWIVVGLPPYLFVYGLQVLVPRIMPVGIGTVALAGLAGIAGMCTVFATLLLNATIYRWALEEPIPSARPFATEPPDPPMFEDARDRLAMLLGSRPTGQNF